MAGRGGRMSANEVRQTVREFIDATNRRDVDRMLALVSDDVVFEGTTPPDGLRITGDKGSLRKVWESIFRESPNAVVETEELFVCGDRCTALMRFVFDAEHPDQGHVRAVDVIRVVRGEITEKLSYVKG
jgi:ketosteroid isomerase-like protein